jgi:hypothetical protein
MPIKFKCPECGEPLEYGDSAAGTRVRCVGCRRRIKVPEEDDDARDQGPAFYPSEAQTTPKRGPSVRHKLPPAPARSQEEDDDDPEPRSRRRPSAAPMNTHNLLITLFATGAAMLLAGLIGGGLALDYGWAALPVVLVIGVSSCPRRMVAGRPRRYNLPRQFRSPPPMIPGDAYEPDGLPGPR